MGLAAASLLAVTDALGTLTQLLILMTAAVTSAWLLRLVRAPAIIGFLIAGIVIGPAGCGWIQAAEVTLLAELGLVLLLFTVGLELAPQPLLMLGRGLLAASGLQLGVTALAVGAAAMLFGGLDGPAALLAGFAVALSSTAIVLKQLSDRGELETPTGALTTGILLIQDVAVIALMMLLPVFAHVGGDAGAAAARLALSAVGLLVALLCGWYLLPVVINALFRRGGRELLTLFAVLMACLGAWLAAQANWSWPLGACVAGLLLARTDLRHQLAAEVGPFRDVLNALFFVSIGLLLDRDTILRLWPGLALGVAAVLTIKIGLTSAAVLSAGWPARIAIQVGLGLCTISEFGYVLLREGGRLELLSPATVHVLVALTVGTMLVGAMLVPVAGPLAHALASRLPSFLQREELAVARLGRTPPGLHHVLVVGYGVNGRNLAHVLRSVRIPFAVVEANRRLAQMARAEGDHVLVGDATRIAILEHAGLAEARVLVVAIADLDAVRRIVAQVRRAYPRLTIVARTRFESEVDTLARLGANIVIPEEFETSIEIFAHVLRQYGVPNNVIEQQITIVRAGKYGMFRGLPTERIARAEWLHALEAAATQTFLLPETSPAVGQTLAQTNLRRATGANVVVVTRGGVPTANPPPDFRFAAGDVLVLVGPHKSIDAAKLRLTAAASPGSPESAD